MGKDYRLTNYMARLCTILTVMVLASHLTTAQEIPTLTFEELNQRIRGHSEVEVLVVNFWATWCKPCIQELPYFDSLSNMYPDQVKVLLVSLDFDVARAAAYKKKKNVASEIVYLDEVDHDAWINHISPNWSGAIPATLMVHRNGAEQFYEQAFTQKALYTSVEQLLTLTP